MRGYPVRMKLLLQPTNVRLRPAVERLVERRLLALAARQRLEAAVVRLEEAGGGSPRFHASVLLRVPGPDIHATACDHTVRVAVEKVLGAVEAQVAARSSRRRHARRVRPVLTSGALWW